MPSRLIRNPFFNYNCLFRGVSASSGIYILQPESQWQGADEEDGGGAIEPRRRAYLNFSTLKSKLVRRYTSISKRGGNKDPIIAA